MSLRVWHRRPTPLGFRTWWSPRSRATTCPMAVRRTLPPPSAHCDQPPRRKRSSLQSRSKNAPRNKDFPLRNNIQLMCNIKAARRSPRVLAVAPAAAITTTQVQNRTTVYATVALQTQHCPLRAAAPAQARLTLRGFPHWWQGHTSRSSLLPPLGDYRRAPLLSRRVDQRRGHTPPAPLRSRQIHTLPGFLPSRQGHTLPGFHSPRLLDTMGERLPSRWTGTLRMVLPSRQGHTLPGFPHLWRGHTYDLMPPLGQGTPPPQRRNNRPLQPPPKAPRR